MIITLDREDRVQKIAYGNSIVATTTYDKRSRPLTIKVSDGATNLLNLTYGYDAKGNVKTITRPGVTTESYGYDKQDRLISAMGAWGTITYTYDKVGNRKSRVDAGVTTNYEYGTDNRLGKTWIPGSTTSTFSYDGAGNLKAKVVGPDTWTYGYDPARRLIQIAKNSNTLGQYQYDGAGRRTRIVEGSTTTTYIYAGTQPIYEKAVNGGNTNITRHIFGQGLQLAKVVIAGGTQTYYYHQDHLGNTRLVTRSDKSQAFSSNYKPFGAPANATGTEKFAYTGQLQDINTGLYYLGARFYDPDLGRFISPDLLLGYPGNPQSLDRYVYVLNNPLILVDPLGQDGGLAHDRTPPPPSSGKGGGFPNPFANIGSIFAPIVQPVVNAWNSLPPEARTVITIAASAAIIIGTGGAAAPVILGLGLAAGAGAMGIYAAHQVLTGQAITGQGLLQSFAIGFAVGTAVASAGAAVGLIGEEAVAEGAAVAGEGMEVASEGEGVAAEATQFAADGGGREVSEAYEVASGGGKHAGFLENYEGRSVGEIARARDSLLEVGEEHLNKIRSPASYIYNWADLSEHVQSGIIAHWGKEAANAFEQADILRDLLRAKGGLP